MATLADLTTIARAPEWQARVRYAMVAKAIGEHATAGPDERALIQTVLRGAGNIEAWSMAALTSSTIAAATHALDGSTISDADLTAAVAGIWSALVG
jgi:hypothetical protein